MNQVTDNGYYTNYWYWLLSILFLVIIMQIIAVSYCTSILVTSWLY